MRHAKQLIYGVLYLIFWIALGSGIYFHYIKPAPSCFDNLKNQNEEGIDCGGVCSNECIPALQPITASNVFLLPIVPVGATVANPSSAFLGTPAAASSTRVSLLAQVRNPNPDYGAAGFNYTFTLYDDAGARVALFPGSSYIYGAEVKYIAMPNVELPVSAAKIKSVTLSIAQPVWKKTSLFAKPMTEVNLSPVETNGTFTVPGVVRNNEAIPLHVDLVAVFFDANGVPRAVSLTSLDRLQGKESRQFAIFHPLIDSVVPDRTQVFASAYAKQ